jgi:NADH:ubiquinone oxidoreductase subunit E
MLSEIHNLLEANAQVPASLAAQIVTKFSEFLTLDKEIADALEKIKSETKATGLRAKLIPTLQQAQQFVGKDLTAQQTPLSVN